MSGMLENRCSVKFLGRENLEMDLRRMIRENLLNSLQPISTEMELAGRYDISRSTVRKVLQTLTNEGLLYKRQGCGTFVVPPEGRPHCSDKKIRILIFLPETVPNISNLDPYDGNLVAGIADYMFIHDGQMELRSSGDWKCSTLIDQYRNLKFDGIIWERPGDQYYPVISELHHLRIPQVTISRWIKGVPALFFDYYQGIRNVVRFLHGILHRSFVFIDIGQIEPIFLDRRKFFENELKKYGIADAHRYVYAFSEKLTRENLDEIFSDHPDLTAILCSSGLFSDLYRNLLDCGRKIPEDLSLISFGENAMVSRIGGGSISVLREPRERIGRRAAQLIAQQVAGRSCSVEREMVPGELVIGESVSSPSRAEGGLS